MRMTTTTQQPAAVVCLQAQHVAGLPFAAEGRQVLLRLLQQPASSGAAVAAAVCRGGVAAFHDQVLLLDCAPVSSSIVSVAVTVDDGRHDQEHGSAAAVVDVNLAEQLRRPSPRVLSFVTTIGGAVLSLTLHHRLVVAQRRRHYSVSGCNNCLAADLLLSCLRVPRPTGGSQPPAGGGRGVVSGHHHDDYESASSSSSSGFITIEKGTISISRRRPPSDNMLTTDDEEEKVMKEEEDIRKVEEEFLAMLDGDDLLDLDALIKDAEAELHAPRKLMQ